MCHYNNAKKKKNELNKVCCSIKHCKSVWKKGCYASHFSKSI